eukprot:gene5048-22459_t
MRALLRAAARWYALLRAATCARFCARLPAAARNSALLRAAAGSRCAPLRAACV